MFRPNNPHINTEILEERAALELEGEVPATQNAAASRERASSAAPVADAASKTESPVITSRIDLPPENPQTAPAAATPSAQPKRTIKGSIRQGVRRLPLLGTLARWAWSLLHIRRISEAAFDAYALASLAQDHARDAKDIARDEGRDARDEARERLHALEQRIDERLKHLDLGHQKQLKSLERRFVHYEASTGELTVALGATRRDLIRLQEQREVQRLQGEIEMIRCEMLMLQQPPSPSGNAASGSSSTSDGRAASKKPRHLDTLRLALEEEFGEPRQSIKQHFLPCLERLQAAHAGQPETPVLDLGCGRGEWIELLKENGLSAYGVDPSKAMVERAQSMGLDALHADILEHLHSLPPASRSAITVLQRVEPRTLETLVDLLDEVLRVLAPRGILILAASDPAGSGSHHLSSSELDQLPPEALPLILAHCGFADADIMRRAAETSSAPGHNVGTPRSDARPQHSLDYLVIAQRR
jgi:SAM-dependent methyltransferase/flagellar motility protein MotE (MotC chaperone)